MRLNPKNDFERFIFGSLQDGYPGYRQVDEIEHMPFLDKTFISDIPAELTAFNDRNRISEEPSNVGIHFYKADNLFKTALLNPLTWVERFAPFKTLITPDVSIGDGMPRWVRVRNTVMARSAGAIWNEQGFPVVANLRWRSPADYGFVASGIHQGSVVAVSNYGNRREPQERAIFEHGVIAMVEMIQPEAIILYGSIDNRLRDLLESRTQVFLFRPYTTTALKKGNQTESLTLFD
jgi:hypothetical protein